MAQEIFSLIDQQEDRISRDARIGLIIQPGAIGDCVLTLALAEQIKTALDLGSITFMGHTDYISHFVGRSCVSSIKSVDMPGLHRLFATPGDFHLADGDSLLSLFLPYTWIITFMGAPCSDFERNLIFTATCTHSCEVTSVRLRPDKPIAGHITEFHSDELISSHWPLNGHRSLDQPLLWPSASDLQKGIDILSQRGLDDPQNVIVIAPGAGSIQKRWPLENFLHVAEHLRRTDRKICFLLGPAENEHIGACEIANLGRLGPCLSDLPLADVLAVLAVAGGFIGNDSGITHLAGALGRPTITIFGPTDSTVYRPLGPLVTPIQFDPTAFASVNSKNQQKIAAIAAQL